MSISIFVISRKIFCSVYVIVNVKINLTFTITILAS